MPIEVIILIFGILVLIGGTILGGQWLSIKKPRELDAEVRRLAGELESMRSELELLSGSTKLLKERLDFAERLLLPPKTGASPPDSE